MKPTNSSSRKRLLITGGLGFIGSRVIQRVHQNYEIVVIDWNSKSDSIKFLKDLNIEIIIKDIADIDIWPSIPPSHLVLHAAGQISAEESKINPLRDFLSNALGTLNVAEYASKHKADVIYCNSIRIYSPEFTDSQAKKGIPINEKAPTITTSRINPPPYAISKFTGEQYMIQYARRHNFRIISHRMSGIVGPNQKGTKMHGWIDFLVKCIVQGIPYTIFGDGDQSRDILYIDDLVDLLEMELADFNHFCDDWFSVYNIGCGKKTELSINNVIEYVNKKYKLEFQPEKGSSIKDEPRHYVSDISKISSKGWLPKHNDPQKIIDTFVKSHMKNKNKGIRNE